MSEYGASLTKRLEHMEELRKAAYHEIAVYSRARRGRKYVNIRVGEEMGADKFKAAFDAFYAKAQKSFVVYPEDACVALNPLLWELLLEMGALRGWALAYRAYREKDKAKRQELAKQRGYADQPSTQEGEVEAVIAQQSENIAGACQTLTWAAYSFYSKLCYSMGGSESRMPESSLGNTCREVVLQGALEGFEACITGRRRR